MTAVCCKIAKHDPQGTFKESGMKYLSSLVDDKC